MNTFATSNHGTPVLNVDLQAICANYHSLKKLAGNAACAAVLKADAYGLGVTPIASALFREGCKDFFVANLEEGIRLREIIPVKARIYVLHGLPNNSAVHFVQHNLIPVLNDPADLQAWSQICRLLKKRLPAALQVDTGMSRLGFSPNELARFLEEPRLLEEINLRLVMSHLACADSPLHPLNSIQRNRFEAIRKAFPNCAASLSNSSGIHLGVDFHFDLVRPGAAFYGINPQPGTPNPLKQVVRLSATIIQTRKVQKGEFIGYGANYRATSPIYIATIGIGYADGWLRSLSGKGTAYIDGVQAPFVGTISMDSIMIDVTGFPAARVDPGRSVDLICPQLTIDDVAQQAGTIGYEMLTRLGRRIHRKYESRSNVPA